MQPLTTNDPAEIAGYRLRARLGIGGMGQVYLAYTAAGRAVAVKVVRPDLGDDAEFRNRFRQEVAAASRVHGLCTAQVLDADPAAAPPWLVTAYVPGPSLEQAVAEHGPMPTMTVMQLVAGVAEALEAIHAAGIVHRDLKPSNVILAPDGPRVIDFGIARSVEAASLTRTGTRIGSPQYMAPEQFLGQAVSPAIDVFALGSLAVYAASGHSAFGEGDDTAVLYRILHQPADLSEVPGNLRQLIEGCLAKDPALRPTPHQVIGFCRAQADGADQVGRSWLPPVVAATMAQHAATPPGLAVSGPALMRDPPGNGNSRAGTATPQPGFGHAPPISAPTINSAGGTLDQPPSSPSPGRGRRPTVIGATAAAVVVMILITGGAFFVLRSRSHHPVPSPAGSASGAASAPVRASGGGWPGGTWAGPMSQPLGVVPRWQANLTFSSDGGGTFKFGGLGCSGQLDWISHGRTHASVDLQVTRDPRSLCVQFGLMTLTKSGADTMHVVWRATSDPGNTATGNLTRAAVSG